MLTLGHYVQLVYFTGRLLRAGKAAISAEVTEIFERLRTTGEAWQARRKTLRAGKWFGRFFAAGRETLRATAEQMGVRKLANLAAAGTGRSEPSTTGAVIASPRQPRDPWQPRCLYDRTLRGAQHTGTKASSARFTKKQPQHSLRTRQ